MKKPQRTLSILQRVPVILAVTAASYGLAQPQFPLRNGNGSQASGQHSPAAAPAHNRNLPR